LEDRKTGPTEPSSTVLSTDEEAMIVAFRRHTLLPLDDCLYALQPTIPHLSRSSLHRCLRRHGISRLPDMEGDKPKRQKFKRYPIGYFHIHRPAVDNGIQFAEQPRNRNSVTYRKMRFDMICEANGIEHRLTKPNHPSRACKHALPGNAWTNGQVERMNRTIKDATVKRYHYDNHDQLRSHLSDFLDAYNYARRLKTLSGLTPYEYICKIWTSEPDRFILSPIHQMPGPNT